MSTDIGNEQDDLDETLDWGSMNKREFKRREMEHELRNEVPLPKPNPSRKFPAKATSNTNQGYFPHKVGFQDKEKAKAEGMRWHPEKKSWYHSTKDKSDKSEFPKLVRESVAENLIENMKEVLLQEITNAVEARPSE